MTEPGEKDAERESALRSVLDQLVLALETSDVAKEYLLSARIAQALDIVRLLLKRS
jgi:hypothetical protein